MDRAYVCRFSRYTVCGLPVSSKHFFQRQKILQVLRGFAKESPLRPSAHGQNGRSSEGASIEKAGEVLWFFRFCKKIGLSKSMIGFEMYEL
jgi:hypothetical protein